MCFSSLSRDFSKFLIVGISGSILSLSTILLLTELLRLWYVFSVVIGNLLGLLNNFFWNRRWTFYSTTGSDYKINPTNQLIRYALMTLGNFLVNLSVVIFFTEVIQVWYGISAVLGILTAFGLNFLISRTFVFHH